MSLNKVLQYIPTLPISVLALKRLKGRTTGPRGTDDHASTHAQLQNYTLIDFYPALPAANEVTVHRTCHHYRYITRVRYCSIHGVPPGVNRFQRRRQSRPTHIFIRNINALVAWLQMMKATEQRRI